MDAISVVVANRSTLTAGPAHDITLRELAVRGSEQLGGNRLWHLDGLWIEASLQYDAADTQQGATAGRRLAEFFGRVVVRIPGWPGGEILFDLSGRAIRERCIQMFGKVPVPDPTDVADANNANVTDRLVLYLPCSRPHVAVEQDDFLLPALLAGQGSMTIDLVSSPVLGVTLDDIDVIVTADLKARSPKKPTFWRAVERTPTNDAAFDVVSKCEAFLAMWAYLTGTRSADQGEAQFEETTQIRAQIGGQLVHDGRTSIRALTERYNAKQIRDAAANASSTAPIVLPILLPGQSSKVTKAFDGQVAARIEGNAALGASGNGASGVALRLVTEEIIEAPAGSKEIADYSKALGVNGRVVFDVKPKSKAPMLNTALASRLPATMRRLAGSRRAAVSQAMVRGRYGF